MTEDQKKNLEYLRNKYAGSADSIAYIDDVEASLSKLMEEQQIARNPIFQAIVSSSQKKIDEINILLMTDGEMDDKSRQILFAQKKAYLFVFKSFKLETQDQAVKLLEATIREKIAE